MEEPEEISVDVSNIFKSIQTACDVLTQRGQEYLLVTADPISHSCMKIGSEKGRQFLDVNSELVINFFSFCFGDQIIGEEASFEEIPDKLIVPSGDSWDGGNTKSKSAAHSDLDNQSLVKSESDLKVHENSSSIQENISINQKDKDDTEKDSVSSDEDNNLETLSENLEDNLDAVDISSPTKTVDDLSLNDKDKVTQDNENLPSLCGNSAGKVTALESEKSESKITIPNKHDHRDSRISPPYKSEQIETQSTAESETVHNDNVENVKDINISSDIPQITENIPKSKTEKLASNQSDILEITSDITLTDDLPTQNTGHSVAGKLVSDFKIAESESDKINIVNVPSFDEKQRKKQFKTSAVKLTVEEKDENIESLQKSRKTENKTKSSNDKTRPGLKKGKLEVGKKIEKPKDTTKTNSPANLTNSTKPTCSICKSSFSRIHSLKGHMLIWHQLEMTLEELQNNSAKLEMDVAEKSETASDIVEYKTDAKSISLKKQKLKTKTLTKKIDVEKQHITFVDDMDESNQNNDIKGMGDMSKNQPAKKRKTDNESPMAKKSKMELNETKSTESFVPTMTIKDEVTNEENHESDVVVLEENHDENVPIKANKTSTKRSHCDICNKYFQRHIYLTIHNIRFHPSKIMQQFGVDIGAPPPIKKEINDLDEYKQSEEGQDLDDMNDNQQENRQTDSLNKDDESTDLETLMDPRDRLKEIQQNDQIRKHINITELESSLCLSCNYCEFSCNEFHQVLVHIARIHPDLSADLDMMMTCFYGIKTYSKKCDECHLVFKSVASLWNHISEAHPLSIETCNKKKKLRKLIKKYKSKKSFVRCEICQEQFRSVRALENHMVIHPEAGKMYNCPQCYQSFATKTNMTRHFRQIHLEERKFQCDVCGKSFKSKEVLKYHRSTHEEDKMMLFQCHICKKNLKKKESLQIHLRQHEGIKPYICEFCGMAFSQNGNRNKHVQLIHNNERNLECPKCGRAFKLQEHLKRHMKVHLIREGEMPPESTFNCEYEGCGACYIRASQLKVHVMSKHTLERPFSCETCGKGFTTKDRLLRHGLTHMEATHLCDICHKKFTSETVLATHYKSHQTSVDNIQYEACDNYETVIIPQEHGAPIKVQLAHSEPITLEPSKAEENTEEDQTFYIQTTKSDDDNIVQVEDNTILVDPGILESVLGATSDDHTVYYYVTDS